MFSFQSLHLFKEAWNNYPLCTENNMMPLQLYIAEPSSVDPENDIDNYDYDDSDNYKLGYRIM